MESFDQPDESSGPLRTLQDFLTDGAFGPANGAELLFGQKCIVIDAICEALKQPPSNGEIASQLLDELMQVATSEKLLSNLYPDRYEVDAGAQSSALLQGIVHSARYAKMLRGAVDDVGMQQCIRSSIAELEQAFPRLGESEQSFGNVSHDDTQIGNRFHTDAGGSTSRNGYALAWDLVQRFTDSQVSSGLHVVTEESTTVLFYEDRLYPTEGMEGRVCRLTVSAVDDGARGFTPDLEGLGLTAVTRGESEGLHPSFQRMWGEFGFDSLGLRGKWKVQSFNDDVFAWPVLDGRSLEAALACLLQTIRHRVESPQQAVSWAIEPNFSVSAKVCLDEKTKRAPDGSQTHLLASVGGMNQKFRAAIRAGLQAVIVADDQTEDLKRESASTSTEVEPCKTLWDARHRLTGPRTLLARYHQSKKDRWRNEWITETELTMPEESATSDPQSRPELLVEPDRKVFISGQGLHVLSTDATDQAPWQHLDASRLRGRLRSTHRTAVHMSHFDASVWKGWSRNELLAGTIEGQPSKRIVLVTDSGFGKTKCLEWLDAHIGDESPDRCSFYLPVAKLPANPDDLILEHLVALLDDDGTIDRVHCLKTLRDTGRIVLLLDAVDQAGGESAIKSLERLVNDSKWSKCRFVITSRPEAVVSQRRGLFKQWTSWQFAVLDEFTDEQLNLYLGGVIVHGQSRLRSELLPSDGREIAHIPRVAEAIKELTPEQLREVRTPSDVFAVAIYQLIERGLMTDDAWMFGHPKNFTLVRQPEKAAKFSHEERADSEHVAHAFVLLSAISVEMTLMSSKDDRALRRRNTPQPRPIYSIEGAKKINKFKDRVFVRVKQVTQKYNSSETGWDRFETDLQCLAAMDSGLSHVFLEPSPQRRIEWANRSIQDFFSAYWLANFATPDESAALWNCVYLPWHEETQDLYWMWRYLCEMPDTSTDPETWIQSVGVLFTPGDGKHWSPWEEEGTRRSNEMIFRSWPRMAAYSDAGHWDAEEVLSTFLSEFEQEICSGSRGESWARRADGLRQSFVELPDGDFLMGSPKSNMEMPDDYARECQSDLDEARAAKHDNRLDEWFDEWATRAERLWAPDTWAPLEAARERQLAYWKKLIRTAIESDGLEHIRRERFRKDQHLRYWEVSAFQLCRSPVINAWYRLFDPSHGTDHWPDTINYSVHQDESIEQPAIDFVIRKCLNEPADIVDASLEAQRDSVCPTYLLSFFDAWVFAMWLHWDGLSCRLPTELEWEYAVKYGTDDCYRFWWGNEPDDGTRCNHNHHFTGVTPPSPDHVNPHTKALDPAGIGIMDQLGTLWEWCRNQYVFCYSDEQDDEHDPTALRVLRGGAYDKTHSEVRSAFRNTGRPYAPGQRTGMRLARESNVRGGDEASV